MEPCTFSWLTPASFLEVTGPDAATFLQGQFTNDLAAPAEACPVVYGLWLEVKGRILADSFVLRREKERFQVFSVACAAALVRKRLEDFIIADEVEVVDHTDDMAGFVVFGPGASEALISWGLEAPPAGKYFETDDATVFRSRVVGREACWHVLVPAEAEASWKERLAGFAPVGPEALAALRCRSGVAAIPEDVGPRDLPNEAGLEQEAISYTKGCFLGQEVMARLKNLGQVRRRLFVVRSRDGGGGLPDLPVDLFLPGGGRRVGELRSLHEDDATGRVGLAILQLAAVEPGSVLQTAPESGARGIDVIAVADGRAW